jgi:hypothetical protein
MSKFWTWDQSAGMLLDPDGKRAGGGYSGRRDGLNNPKMQYVRATGPIPQGNYRIGRPKNSVRTGRFVMDLTPMPGTDTRGRSAFQIHGDNARKNFTASSGCIILARPIRQRIADSGVSILRVVE